MKIDGIKLAEKISSQLKKRINKFKLKNINPKLAIILIGNNPVSKSYVKQKEIRAKELGIDTFTLNFSSSITKNKLKEKLTPLNNDKSIHGIIIQRPLPSQLESNFVTDIIRKDKDIDGFRDDSFFTSPMGQVIAEVLKKIYGENFVKIIKQKKITVIGKGETGGGPVIKFLKEQGITPAIIDSKTKRPENLLKKSDIIISTVGKPDIIKTKDLQKGVVLIGIGMYKNSKGEFEADYNQKEVAKIASFYTPVPGGTGPLTVVMLLKNVVKAAGKS